MIDLLNYPFDPHELLRKKKSIKRHLQLGGAFTEKRIAILGGSTTAEVKDMLELFLLQANIQPVFYESEYNKYFEDIMFENNKLTAFKPDIIYIHTTTKNITAFPNMKDMAEDVRGLLDAQYEKFCGLWLQIEKAYACPVIQNNFEFPSDRPLGNLDCYDARGKTLFVNRLNQLFADYAGTHKNFYLQDIHYLSSWVGLESWYDSSHWHSYKYALGLKAIPALAHNLSSIMKAIWGKSQKCLVLDLDNTLWGGVIGEDGAANIKIGKERAEAEAFHDFQTYVKTLKERGIVLAVCSKNDLKNAKEGFEHPDSVLHFEDFAAFEANWGPKDESVKNIARTVNIGEDALVFVDDNPAERSIVRAQVPSVSVPEIGADAGNFITILDKSGYFETVALSPEDLQRSQYYEEDSKRTQQASQFKNYADFLHSLNMVAEIGAFSQDYLERITQLINKTNQFNLTTKRYALSQIETITKDQDSITLYGRLADKFGDNGLITCIIGHIKEGVLHLDLWLMSCRVLKRDMEQVMFDQIIAACRKRSLTNIIGYYLKTSKNDMVTDHYRALGFELVLSQKNGDSIWSYTIGTKDDTAIARPIRVVLK